MFVISFFACIIVCAFAEDTSLWQFRLAGNSYSPLAGRLEMRPNSTMPWGTVCKDKFKDNDFGATAACRSLGLVGSTGKYHLATYGAGPGSAPIYLTDVACTASDAFIQNCTRAPLLLTASCVHSEDVSIYCIPDPALWQFKMVNGTAPSNGIVMMRPLPMLPWGHVSNFFFLYISWDAARRILCRTMGYPSPVSIPRALEAKAYGATLDMFLLPTEPPYLDVSACANASATHISQCTYLPVGATSSNWPSTRVLALDCNPLPSVPVGPVEVKLVNGVTPTSGLVLIRPNASMPWGTIAGTEFTTNPGVMPFISTLTTPLQQQFRNALCHSAGFPTATAAIWSRYGDASVVPADAYGWPIAYGSYYNCSGAFNLSDCRVSERDLRFMGSEAAYAGGVDCFPTAFSFVGWEARLVGGSTPLVGRVELRPNTSSPWLGICLGGGFYAYQSMWSAVCRLAGINTSSAIRSTASFGAAGRSQYYLGFAGLPPCPSVKGVLPAGATIQDCSVATIGAHSCGVSQDMALDCGFPPRSEMEVRLVNGPAGKVGAGRIEVRPNASFPWGTVADVYGTSMTQSWQPYNAFAFCRSLGFMNTTNPIFSTTFGPGNTSQPVWWRDLRCTASDTFVQYCESSNPFGFADFATHLYDLSLDCFPPPFEPIFTLVDGGAPWRGRLMYQFATYLPAGSVCNDFFKHNHFSWLAACRSAGFLNVTSARYMSYGPAAASVPISLDDIVCTENDRFIQNCTAAPIGVHNCHHGEDAGVDCKAPPDDENAWQFRLADGTTTTNGRVEMRPSGSHVWGSICAGPYFNKTRAAWLAACRQVGFTNVTRARWRYFGKAVSDAVYLDNVSCVTGDQLLVNCSHFPLGSYRCSPEEPAGVDCDPPLEPADSWQFRLADGTAATNGRVEMRPSPTMPWGSICAGPYFNKTAAAWLAACRQVGFTNVTRARWRYFGKGSDIVYLDNVSCATGDNLLVNCSHLPLEQTTCSADDVAGVDCDPPADGPASWSFRLTDGKTPTSGRLEVRADTAAPWGLVCKNGLLARTALLAVCRGVGHLLSTHPILYTGLPVSTVPFVLDSGNCSAAGTIQGCTFGPLYAHSCSPGDELYVDCFPTDTTTMSASAAASTSMPNTITGAALIAPHTRTVTDVIVSKTYSPSQQHSSVSLSVAPTKTIVPVPTTTPATVAVPSTMSSTAPASPATTTSYGPTSTAASPTTATAMGPVASAPPPASPIPTTPVAGALSPHPAPTPTTYYHHPCPNDTTVVSLSAVVPAVPGPRDVTLVGGAPLFEPNPLPLQLVVPANMPLSMSCSVLTISALSCRITVHDEASSLSSRLTGTVALASHLAACTDVSIALVLVPPAQSFGFAAAVSALREKASAPAGGLLFLADPTAFDAMAAVVALLAACAGTEDQQMARAARYLLSPFADLAPGAVILLHVGLCALVMALYRLTNTVHVFGGRRVPGWVCWAAASGLYPGVAASVAAIAAAATNGSDGLSIAGLCIGAAFLIAVPSVSAFVVLRSADAVTYESQNRPPTSLVRKLAWPTGAWSAAIPGGVTPCSSTVSPSPSVHAFGPMLLQSGPRGHLLFTLKCMALLVVCAFVGTQPQAEHGQCGRMHLVAAAILLVMAVVMVLARCYSTPLGGCLHTLSLIALAAFSFFRGLDTAREVRLLCLAVLAVAPLLRSLHTIILFMSTSQRPFATSTNRECELPNIHEDFRPCPAVKALNEMDVDEEHLVSVTNGAATL